jgi:hypothetical protein
MLRRITVASAFALGFSLIATPALACGGLINPNGSVSLVRTTTLAAYHNGVEHYVTSFEFAGGTGEFGSIIPLPGIPSKVIRGGDWTLQRLVQETQPQEKALLFAEDAAVPAAAPAQVLLKTKIDALDIVVLKGGGTAVGTWAREHGFLLPPDAPEILDFYAERSPIFMTIRFDASRAQAEGLNVGDGTPVHVVIPTPNPWVPLRILTLGAPSKAPVEADVFLLTDRMPALLPEPIDATDGPVKAGAGLELLRSEPASASLLTDLRSDKGMAWLPNSDVWLTYLKVDTNAGALTYDLAIDATGAGHPSPVAAGLVPVPPPSPLEAAAPAIATALLASLVLLSGLAIGGYLERRRFQRPAV